MPGAAAPSRAAAVLIWAGLGLVLLFLYAPLVPPALHSFEGAGAADLFRNYAAIFDDARLLRALSTSLVVGALVALIAPLLALLAAEAVRVFRTPRLIIAIILLPLFALANTGVTIDSASLAELTHANSLGIALGLIVGKPLGVIVLSLVAVRLGVCSLPAQVKWSHMVGAGLLGGIGFTMSIFITNLAFAGQAPLVASSKLTVLIASLISGVLGFIWLRWVSVPKHR